MNEKYNEFDLEELYLIDLKAASGSETLPRIYLLTECMRTKQDTHIKIFMSKNEDCSRMKNNMSELSDEIRSVFKKHDQKSDISYEYYLIEDNYKVDDQPKISMLTACLDFCEHEGNAISRRCFTRRQDKNDEGYEIIINDRDNEDFIDEAIYKYFF